MPLTPNPAPSKFVLANDAVGSEGRRVSGIQRNGSGPSGPTRGMPKTRINLRRGRQRCGVWGLPTPILGSGADLLEREDSEVQRLVFRRLDVEARGRRRTSVRRARLG
jgi:hypothetical protein